MLGYHVIDKALASGWGLQAEQSGQSAVFLHDDAIHIQQACDISALGGYGNGQSGQEDASWHPENNIKKKKKKNKKRKEPKKQN